MPKSTTPDLGVDTAPDPAARDGAALDVNVVHVIQSSYHYSDPDGYSKTDEALMEDEGWFADAALAAARCDQLNLERHKYYDTVMAARKREREAKILDAETKNREAAVLRAAGMTRADVAVPKPFVAPPFENYAPEQDPYTTYACVTIRRSDNDRFAQATAVASASGE